MTDRPIIFSAPMIRALLAGQKTQTRRMLNPQPDPPPGFDGRIGFSIFSGQRQYEMRGWTEELGPIMRHRPLKWAPRDRLWVKETWARTSVAPIIESIDNPWVVYREQDNRTDYGGPWKSARFMPKTASRITLIVKGVKIERLHTMNRGDAMDEGCPFPNMANGENPLHWFRDLWTYLHGPDAWAANPWVAAISFRVIRANIDSQETRA